MSASVGAYEDLGKPKDDRYEYIYPEFNFYKDFGQKIKILKEILFLHQMDIIKIIIQMYLKIF